ncbi:NCS1 family nucleobase:cation symporter-1 [Psychroserpens ponticola]|uniref:NCS1 family nucleobase:cation symporter-1 n=1 Tax=Psychroserpens ponticola TaxID=2932268 RepID=A0ABY7RTJ9_9FLAO|nr:NCS1 family nucleobase:cation symporter-1 [Psychroserpens ponticola]WCO00432.1 NCS1 family nucleobase:cation symporter-1 [Psychroserpens ponticola]
MNKDIVELQEDVSSSSLYSEDLAPVPSNQRTWTKWHLAAIWVGMAVCIPTYLLASYMIKSGLNWIEALIIIGLANLIITIPMVLNGHAGVKYGVPFPVIGRSSFGIKGIHLPSVIRGLVACGWFGVNTWLGGMALYSIFIAVSGNDPAIGLSIGQFICFGIFWVINMYFIWKGTESIKWLEEYSAPILIVMGLILIGWGYSNAGGFGIVLEQGKQLEIPVAEIYHTETAKNNFIHINPIKNMEGVSKASEYQLILNGNELGWNTLSEKDVSIGSLNENDAYQIQLRNTKSTSSIVDVTARTDKEAFGSKIWKYLIWLTAMLGFWATMSLSIADITRYSSSQKAQVKGQFIGLPGTMMLYSFVGIFVTCAAIINFDDILIANDAPWDPIALLAKFDSVWVVVIAQIFMIIATLSTNIAANVIAPANAFSNLFPKKISFRGGGFITGIIGILIFPWKLLYEIQGLLIDVSAVLGPVLAILVCDYYLIRKKQIQIADLYKENGIYSYGKSGINKAAMISLFIGAFVAIGGKWIPAMSSLYAISWFSGFIVSFVLYYVLMKKK